MPETWYHRGFQTTRNWTQRCYYSTGAVWTDKLLFIKKQPQQKPPLKTTKCNFFTLAYGKSVWKNICPTNAIFHLKEDVVVLAYVFHKAQSRVESSLYFCKSTEISFTIFFSFFLCPFLSLHFHGCNYVALYRFVSATWKTAIRDNITLICVGCWRNLILALI